MSNRLTLVFLLLSVNCFAQWLPLSNQLRMNYPNDSLRVKFVSTDQRGVLWIGSNQGLLRCDQEEAILILPITNLTCMASVDSLLWLGTDNGTIEIFDPVRLKSVNSFELPDSASISDINASSDKICVSTFGGGSILISERDTIQYGADVGLSGTFVYQTVIYNNFLVAATDIGVVLFDFNGSDSSRQLNTSITQAIALQDSTLWIGSYKNGIMLLNLGQPKGMPVSINRDLKISKFTTLNGRIFGLSSEGIFEFTPRDQIESQVIFKSPGLVDFVVLKEGILLALKEDGSIYSLDLRLYQNTGSIADNVTAVTANSNWLFTAGNGVVCGRNFISGNCEQEYNLEANDLVVSMVADERRLFVGTFNDGIYVFDIFTGQSSHINKSNGLADNSVLSLSIRRDTLWFTTLSGLSYLEPNLKVGRSFANQILKSTYLYCVLATDSAIFIGTDGRGGYLLKDNTLSKMDFLNPLSDETIYSISRDKDGNIWFTTKKHGLCRFEVNTGMLYKNLGESNDGSYIMVSGGFGSSALLVGKSRIELFWGKSSVLPADPGQFDGLSGDYSNAICVAPNGNFYFASGTKLYIYHPDSLNFPGVYLSSVHANLSAVGMSHMQFDSDINHLAFRFEPIWYQNPDNVQFRYRLIGVESAWNETAGRNAVYPNLKYGSYTFQVQAGQGGKYYPETASSYAFTIAKPFYLRWWFILIFLLSILALAYLILQWQVARTQRKWQSEKKRVESELAVLRNQVNPHFLFNSLNTLLNLIETQPAEAEEYLQRLSDFYRKIIENQDNYILKLHEELRNLKEYIYLQKKRFGSALNLEINLSTEFLDTQIPALTFQLLAENAIKHNVVSQSQPLVIRVYSDRNKIVFSNLKNLLTQHPGGTGMGLENIKTRYLALYKAQVEIFVTEKEFSIKLPIIP